MAEAPRPAAWDEAGLSAGIPQEAPPSGLYPRLGDLSAGIRQDLGRLGGLTLELLETEMQEQRMRLEAVGKWMVPTALSLIAASVLLALALTDGLMALGLSAGLARALVGVLLAGIGFFASRRMLTAMSGFHVVPNETLKQLKENLSWLGEKIRFERK
jgi:hypothetical protein